ncbi:MAG: hypothetical protein LBV71_20475 [Prevotella sp.]|nr:hypothetical protein [Prevotella sp.]
MNIILKKQNIIYLLILIVIVSFTQCSGSVESQLQSVAKETNRDCPIMRDQWTRLDSCSVQGENTFRYYFTIVQIVVTDTTNLKSQIKPQIIETVKNHPSTRIFRDNDVTLVYKYNDEQGKYLFTIMAAPQDYKK